MSHPLKRVRREEAIDIDDPVAMPARGHLPVPARSRHGYRPEEPAALARRYSARYEPVRSGNYDDFETDFNPPPYEWGSASLRHRLRDGEDYRPVRRVVEHARDRAAERDGFFGRFTLRQSFTVAGLLAVIAGGSIGLAATQIDFRGSPPPKVADTAGTAQAEVTTAALSDPAQPLATARKAIRTASIDIADVSGQTGQMIPLPLFVEPERQGQKLAVRLTGLPESAYLTAGKRVARTWVLQPGQEIDVKLVVPEAQASQYQVEVAAIDPATGQLAAPAKQMTVNLEIPPDVSEQAAKTADMATLAKPADKVAMAAPQTEIIEPLPEPIPAPVKAAPAPVEDLTASAAKPEASELIRKGDLLLKVGDLVAARQFYQEAFEQGAVEGAVGAAKSYDPAIYAELNVQGIEPDPGLALEWYQKAGAAGANTAEAVARLTKTP